MEKEIGHFGDDLAPVSSFARDRDFRGFLSDLAEDLVEALGKERGNVGIFRRTLLALPDHPVDGVEDVMLAGFVHD